MVIDLTVPFFPYSLGTIIIISHRIGLVKEVKATTTINLSQCTIAASVDMKTV